MVETLAQGGSPRVRDQHAWALRWLPALGIGVAICLLIAGALAAYSARQDAWRLAEQQSSNLRLALQRDIERNITIFDLSLQGVIEALAEPGIEQVSPGIRRHALFDRAAAAEDLGTIVVVGSGGNVLETSTTLRLTPDFVGRPEFESQRQRSDVGLYLSRASRASFDSAEPGMSISRRISARDGSFAGIVAGALRLSFFKHLFEKIDISSQGSITLIRTDGRIVWRYPTSDGDIDHDLFDSNSFHKMLASPTGQLLGKSMVDGVTRLYSFGRVGSLPLILSVNLAVDDIFARWREKAFIIGPTVALMCVSIAVLSLLFRREMLRRTAAEQALEEAARTLACMAATDALTGLANRRTFEDQLNREWRRTLVEKDVISLLMVDVDHFKSFNDCYGHQEGDRALRMIALGLTDTLSHGSELAARYGGEEFVVLLPSCDAPSAKLVAERVVAAIGAMAIPHASTVAGKMTVSIGVATTRPTKDDRAHDLLKAADFELYAAKRNGRNTIRATSAARDRGTLSWSAIRQ